MKNGKSKFVNFESLHYFQTDKPCKHITNHLQGAMPAFSKMFGFVYRDKNTLFVETGMFYTQLIFEYGI